MLGIFGSLFEADNGKRRQNNFSGTVVIPLPDNPTQEEIRRAQELSQHILERASFETTMSDREQLEYLKRKHGF